MDLNEALKNLNHEDPDVVFKAMKIVSRKASKDQDLAERVVDIFKAKLYSSDLNICAYACWSAGLIGWNMPEKYISEVNHLFNLTNHENPEVRAKALFALGRIGRKNPEVVQERISEIVEHHLDESPEVRMNMIWASENIANSRPELFKDYINVYEDMLDDPDVKLVRGEVPEFFRVMGKNRPDLVELSIPKLELKTHDDNRVTRIHSKGALKTIKKNLKKLD